jgi:hypothetical protein
MVEGAEEVKSLEGTLGFLLIGVIIAFSGCIAARKQVEPDGRDFCWAFSIFGWCWTAALSSKLLGFEAGVNISVVAIFIGIPGYMLYYGCKYPDARRSNGGDFPDSCCWLAPYPESGASQQNESGSG